MANNNDDNIIFEDITPPIDGIKWRIPNTDDTTSPNVIKGRYDSLYSELRDKCNPEKFMIEYDHDRIAIANDIYTQTQETSFYDETILKELRKRAMTELGIKFSTEIIYEELTNLLKPSKYSGTEKFNYANDLYSQVIANAGDIEELERIKEDAKDFYPKPEPPIIGTESQELNDSDTQEDEESEFNVTERDWDTPWYSWDAILEAMMGILRIILVISTFFISSFFISRCFN